MKNKLLRKLKKKPKAIALTVEISNEEIMEYIAEFLEYNSPIVTPETLTSLFDNTTAELAANIKENFNHELRAIIPVMAERLGIEEI